MSSKMYNNLTGNSGTSVTEKLGLDKEVRELKFGSSFGNGNGNGSNKGQQGAFHTIRYDFKPASVDKSKTATLQMGQSGQEVSISMPHYDGTGSTLFKGSSKKYTKECVLIIDNTTGELVLEKLSHNIQVKKTRQERQEGTSGSGGGSSSGASRGPSEAKGAVAPPPAPMEPVHKIELVDYPPISSRVNNIPKISQASKRPLPINVSASIPSIGRKASPSPSPAEPIRSHPHPMKQVQASYTYTEPSLPSLTNIEDLLMSQPQPAATQPQPAAVPPPLPKLPPPAMPMSTSMPLPTKSGCGSGTASGSKVGLSMSESSSDESSSSSSSDEEDSSSNSDMEEVAVPQMPMAISSITSVPVLGSMPSLDEMMDTTKSNILNEDLQLSESSDSD